MRSSNTCRCNYWQNWRPYYYCKTAASVAIQRNRTTPSHLPRLQSVRFHSVLSKHQVSTVFFSYTPIAFSFAGVELNCPTGWIPYDDFCYFAPSMCQLKSYIKNINSILYAGAAPRGRLVPPPLPFSMGGNGRNFYIFYVCSSFLWLKSNFFQGSLSTPLDLTPC